MTSPALGGPRPAPAARLPRLVTCTPPTKIRGVVLVAHGGRERGTEPARWCGLPLLRMIPFAWHLARHGREHGLLVTQLRYRVGGYNDGDPRRDVSWAVAHLVQAHGVPVCLVGHSMGSRAALQAAGDPGIAGIVALAPWCPPEDPVGQLAGRSVMLVHGEDDRVTAPQHSRAFALRAREVTEQVCRFTIAGAGHAMLQYAALWHSLTTAFVLGALDLVPLSGQIASAMALPAERACAVRLRA